MALTGRPAEWKFIVPVPDGKDASEVISRSWTIELNQPVARGGLEYLLTKPLKATAETQRLPQSVEVSIKIDGEVATECRRCCAPLTVAIQEDFMYSYILQSDNAETGQGEEEFSDSGKVTLVVPRLSSSLDVADLVWECLVESLPLYAQCEGECAVPYVPEPSVDPRFLALADLLEQEKDKGGK